ncbi:hypothetical protein E8E14_000700 [Neopestalotiopsis sp. 37M]|nr:hypothetical protein E8E14_000700 [Neopestalotiopsis sp. 37M]
MVRQSHLFAFAALAVGGLATLHEQRSTITNKTIYAYGMNGIEGYPVYSDENGLAVIAANGTDTSGLFEVKWTIDTTGTAAWNVSLNSTEDDASFYIVPDGDGYVPVGFTINDTAPDGAATVGFVLYGSDIMFASGDTYLYQFWASNTSTTGLWNVTWNVDGDKADGSVPVMLKPKAPSSD